jgi:hypothetical protein
MGGIEYAAEGIVCNCCFGPVEKIASKYTYRIFSMGKGLL